MILKYWKSPLPNSTGCLATFRMTSLLAHVYTLNFAVITTRGLTLQFVFGWVRSQITFVNSQSLDPDKTFFTPKGVGQPSLGHRPRFADSFPSSLKGWDNGAPPHQSFARNV
jgi:hypothetical protein